MIIPPRIDYLRQQAQNGRKIMGVLPALYPRELLWAFDILPAEIWDPPDEIVAANAHLQATICPVVKHGLERILKKKPLVTAGYLFPHTCDSLQNLASQVQDLIGNTMPVHTFYNPKGAFNKTSQTYYQAILKNFEAELARLHGPLQPEQLTAACHLGHAIDQRLSAILQARREQRLDLDNVSYFRLLRAGEYLSGPDYLELLNTIPLLDQPEPGTARRLLVSGILPPNEALLAFLDERQVEIVADDLLAVSRRLPLIRLDPPQNPYEYLSDRYFMLPPCSTRATGLEERLRHLNKLIRTARVEGVFFNLVTFCEPELFDHRTLARALKSQGVPVLSLETDLTTGLSGQLRTRLEAFLEMLPEEAAV